MDLMRILRSLEEFLYELVGWLVFYPRTFWRVLRHPAAIARYTQLELEQEPERQFTETISPVLMLILSVALAHALEMLSRVPSVETNTPLAQVLLGSEEALLLTRCVVFCGYALVAALMTLRQQGKAITRETLRTPFSIQAFLVSPFVMLLSAGMLLTRLDGPWASVAAVALIGSSCFWYLWARASAYRAMVDSGWGIALLRVGVAFIVTTALVIALMALVLL
ncbi:MAG TPA: hypothetical protein VLC71_13650 [Thermomonas sp.]|nr:hypothetical protein [Thermomonas sp.]